MLHLTAVVQCRFMCQRVGTKLRYPDYELTPKRHFNCEVIVMSELASLNSMTDYS